MLFNALQNNNDDSSITESAEGVSLEHQLSSMVSTEPPSHNVATLKFDSQRNNRIEKKVCTSQKRDSKSFHITLKALDQSSKPLECGDSVSSTLQGRPRRASPSQPTKSLNLKTPLQRLDVGNPNLFASNSLMNKRQNRLSLSIVHKDLEQGLLQNFLESHSKMNDQVSPPDGKRASRLYIQKLQPRPTVQVIHVEPEIVEVPKKMLEVQKLLPRPLLTIARPVRDNEKALDEFVLFSESESDSGSEMGFGDFQNGGEDSHESDWLVNAQLSKVVANDWHVSPVPNSSPRGRLAVTQGPNPNHPHPLRSNPTHPNVHNLPLRQIRSTSFLRTAQFNRSAFIMQKNTSTLSLHSQGKVIKVLNFSTSLSPAPSPSTRQKIKKAKPLINLKRSNAVRPKAKPQPRVLGMGMKTSLQKRSSFAASMPTPTPVSETFEDSSSRKKTTCEQNLASDTDTRGSSRSGSSNNGQVWKERRVGFHGALVGMSAPSSRVLIARRES